MNYCSQVVIVSSCFILLLALVSADSAISFDRNAMSRNIQSNSLVGARLLSQARRVNNNNNNGNNNGYSSSSSSSSISWVTNYSLKYQGCFEIPQWNEEAETVDDVRILKKSLVRFNLCPSGDCDTTCTEDYGDYIVDMSTYLEAFVEQQVNYCKYLEQNVCNCKENKNDMSEEECLYNCFVPYKVESCMGNVQAQEDNANFNVLSSIVCQEYKVPNDDNVYYMGPYCAEQGGAVYLGLFTDDTCTIFADQYQGRETFANGVGYDLPYGQTNLIEYDCISCQEPAVNNQDGNDASDSDKIIDMCETLYASSGKCESYLTSSSVSQPNNNGCKYMSGISIIQKNGAIVQPQSKANKSALICLGVFGGVFVCLAMYVYYLKHKLDRASIQLSDY